MHEFLLRLSGPQWIVLLMIAIYLVRRLLALREVRSSRPKGRTSLNWPDRSNRVLQSPGVSHPLEPRAPTADAVNAFRMLHKVTLHNVGAVGRLIQYELGRSPGISRDEAIVRAYERWMDDNR